MEALITGLLKSGAPWAIVVAVLLVVLTGLWRRYVATSEKLWDLALQHTRLSTEIHTTLEQLRQDFRDMVRAERERK